MSKRLRLSTLADAPSILAIYAPYVRDTAITFEYEVPSLPEFTQRMRAIEGEYPYIVCEEEGRIIGYAYAHRYKERAAYQWGAELSVYVERTLVHAGVGKALYRALIGLLQLQNVKTVYGCVTSPNPRSEALHARMGFEKIGTFRRAGYKCGAWHDVNWFEKSIGAYDQTPKPVTPLAHADPAAVQAILQGAFGA